MSRRRKGSDRLHGVLVVDKPAGVTSAAVVARVRRALGARRVGHTGTLDPMATGVLPLCLGDATKLAGYLLADDKAYEGELELGVETATLDREGVITARAPERAAEVGEAELRRAMARMIGPLEQIPPMYSAVKQDGVRLHRLAREGVEVERRPRPVRVDRFELLRFACPRAAFAVECSKGTYVRVLVADLGAALGCGAHLTALRRTRAAGFGLDEVVQLDEITEETVRDALIEPAAAVSFLAPVRVPAGRLDAVANGQQLPWRALAGDIPAPSGLIRLLTPAGQLAAIARVEGDRIRYERGFVYWRGT